ncbi:hypothetical protein ACJX0J_035969, partial [Zea mays]
DLIIYVDFLAASLLKLWINLVLLTCMVTTNTSVPRAAVAVTTVPLEAKRTRSILGTVAAVGVAAKGTGNILTAVVLAATVADLLYFGYYVGIATIT